MTPWIRRLARLALCGTVAAAALAPARPAGADHPTVDTGVFISEYLDGPFSDRALEIYNGSGDPVDLEAEGYVVEMHFLIQFGAFELKLAVPVPLTGVVPAGGTHVLVYDGTTEQELRDLADQIFSSPFAFDGNDVVMLVRDGAVVDAMGQLDHVPPPGNPMDDTGLRRLPHVTEGDTDPHDVFDASQEWASHDNSDWSDLGQHTVSVATCTPVADKGLVVGSACATVIHGVVSVVWTVDEGWELRGVALAVADDPAGIPQSSGQRGTNALPSKFAHQAVPADPSTATLTVPAPETGGADVVVAAFADVVDADGQGAKGWATGTPFADRPNSGSWFGVPVG